MASDDEKQITANILIAYMQRADARVRIDEPDRLGSFFETIYKRVVKVNASLVEKRVAADLLVAFLQKIDSKVPLNEPDKVGDYFDILCQHVNN